MIDPLPYQKLVAAIIERAVEDYQTAQERGHIVNNEVVWRTPPRRVIARASMAKRTELRSRFVDLCELVRFFLPGGGMEKCIAIGGLKLDPDAVRERLYQ